MTEAEFQSQVIHLARLHGWLVHHSRPAQNRSGAWSTPITGDAGFPDLVVAHPDRGVVFLELKSDAGRASDKQRTWLRTLQAGHAEAFLIRPADLQLVADRLAGHGWDTRCIRPA